MMDSERKVITVAESPKVCQHCGSYPVVNGKCVHCGYNEGPEPVVHEPAMSKVYAVIDGKNNAYVHAPCICGASDCAWVGIVQLEMMSRYVPEQGT